MYNLTAISSNSTGLLGMTQGVNSVLMGNSLGVLLLIGIATILFMSFQFRTGDPAKSMAATAFLTFGLSLFLWGAGLIPPLAMFITLSGSAAALAFTFKD